MENPPEVNPDVGAVGAGCLGSNVFVQVSLSIFLGVLSGCGDSVETNPARILPVLKQAQRCCDGRCSGSYEGVSRGVACADVLQMESCLEGKRDQCPLKGHGAF
jgi:hypothetical protein